MPRAKPIAALSSAIGNAGRHDLIVVRQRTRLPHTPTRAPAANPPPYLHGVCGGRSHKRSIGSGGTHWNECRASQFLSAQHPRAIRGVLAVPNDRPQGHPMSRKTILLFNARTLLFNALPPFRFQAKNALSRSLFLRSQGCLPPTAPIKGLEANRLPGRRGFRTAVSHTKRPT